MNNDSALRKNRSRTETARRQKKNDGVRVRLRPFINQMHGPGSATLSHRFLCVLGNVCIVQISTNDSQSFYCYSIVHSSRCARSMNLHFFCHNIISLVIIKGMGTI